MVRIVMVPLDGSSFAEEALPLAAEVARKAGAELHLVHVIRPAPDVDLKMPQDDLDWSTSVRSGTGAYLEQHAEALRAEGVSTLTAVLEGRIVPSLQHYAAEQEIGLIVLTTHGTGGVRRWWLGSVADGLLRTGPMDLLIVRPWDDTTERLEVRSRFDRVLVPLDGSDFGALALTPAREMAKLFGAEIVLARVVPAPIELTSVSGVPGVPLAGEGHRSRVTEAREYLESIVEGGDEGELRAVVVEADGAAEGVVECAKSENADLIALSTHGRGGLARAVLGSVADKIIRSSHLPIYVTRPEAQE